MKKIMMAVLLVSALAYGIADASPAAAEPLASSDGAYEVELPDGYRNLRGSIDPEGDEQDYLMLAGHGGESPVYLLSVSEEKSANLPTLSDYSKTLLTGIMASELFTDPVSKIPPEDFSKATELPSMKTCFTAAYGSLQIDYYIYTLEGEDRYYQVCAWTTSDNAAAGPELDQIVRSFRVQDGGAKEQ